LRAALPPRRALPRGDQRSDRGHQALRCRPRPQLRQRCAGPARRPGARRREARGMNAAAVPVLETPRLRLRAHRAGDHAASNALGSAPGVIEHIGGRVFTAEENWRRLLQYRGLWDLLGYGYWAVEDKAGGDYVGDVGFADFAREVTPSLAGMLEA